MICKHIDENIFNWAWGNFLHTVKWLQVFIFNTNNFIYY